jgi:hypothetical protein
MRLVWSVRCVRGVKADACEHRRSSVSVDPLCCCCRCEESLFVPFSVGHQVEQLNVLMDH